METQQLYESGILKKGEDIIEFDDNAALKEYQQQAVVSNTFFGTSVKNQQSFMASTVATGNLLITNKRLLFVKKPGIFSKGLTVSFSCSLGDILSVSTSGLIFKQINVTINRADKTENAFFGCKNIEIFAKKILENKDKFIEEKIIEAKTVIIEEGKKDNATEILKKRLARGEITKEEFHEKIQRT